MFYVIALLLAILSALFGAVVWYFKKDTQETKQMNIRQDKILLQHGIELIELQRKIENNQSNIERFLRILAKKTKTDIGL